MARMRQATTGAVLALTLALAGCANEDEPEDDTIATPTPVETIPVATDPPEAPSPTPTPTPTAAVSQTHVVEAGDTLGAIAARYGVTVEAIVEANDLSDPDVLAIGDELVIPAPE